MQANDPVPHPDGPSGSPVCQKMPGSATISHDMEHLCEEHDEMNDRQYTSGEIEMMFNDGLFGNLAEPDNSGQAENNAIDSAGQQEPAVMSEYIGDNTAPVFLEDNYPTLPRDERGTQLTHLDEGAKNPHGDAAVKPEPEVGGENRCQDLSFDHPMGESGHGSEMQSSTLQSMSEPPQDEPQDTMMNNEPGHQGQEDGEDTGQGRGDFGTQVHAHQDEHEVTIAKNEGAIWSEGPDASETGFEKESQHVVFQKDHDDLQPEQQYGGRMAQETIDQLLGPRGRVINQPSTSTQRVDFWKHRQSMQSGYEGNTMSRIGKETVGQPTQPPNAPMTGLWPTSGMSDLQYRAFGPPIDFANTCTPSHPSIQNTTPLATSNTFPSFQPPTQNFAQQQPLNPYTQSPVENSFARQQQLQALVEEKRRQLENLRRLHEQTKRQAQQPNSFSFTQNQASAPASFLMGPLSYQRAPQSGYRQVPSGNNSTSHWPEMQSGSSQSQMVLRELLASCPVQGQEVVGKSTGENNRSTPGPSTAPVRSKTQPQDSKEDSNNDEPLMTRAKRHPSITSQTSNPSQPSAPPMTITSSPPMPSSPPAAPIDWKLPQYDLHIDLTPADPTQPTAKISLPGLVREELLLSPDHADQEIHLLLNVFLPAQRVLTTPDPQPAVAVLNFHTIALMVIEAYVQYEIGDELGRRNPYYAAPSNEHTGGGGEQQYERIRDARSADVDEIFFAVVDRWRAGRESGKQSLGLIRGVQEFCDVVLDVIYYVKENGLLGGEGQEDEEQQGGVGMEMEGEKEKGKGKAKKVDREEGVAVLKAKPKKRTAVAEKAETGARKKGKAVGKKEEPKKRGRKPAGGITVVKK